MAMENPCVDVFAHSKLRLFEEFPIAIGLTGG